MSAFPAAERFGAIDRALRPKTFWQRFAQALDAYFAYRSRQAVPVIALRRSKREIDRCRQLMHKGSAMAAGASDLTRI
jgi:hypothetical protein